MCQIISSQFDTKKSDGNFIKIKYDYTRKLSLSQSLGLVPLLTLPSEILVIRKTDRRISKK